MADQERTSSVPGETWSNVHPEGQEALYCEGKWIARFSPSPGCSPDIEAARARLAAQAPAMARHLIQILDVADEKNQHGEPALVDDHKAAVEFLLEVSDHIRATLIKAGVLTQDGARHAG